MQLQTARVLGLLGVLAFPALAQAADAPTVSLPSLLSSGYEIKSVTVLPVDVEKLIWPKDAPVGTMVVTLQRSSSIAVCQLSGADLIYLRDNAMANEKLCSKR